MKKTSNLTGTDVLRNASKLLNKKGLARLMAEDAQGRICTAAALVRGATVHIQGKEDKFEENAYLEARRTLANILGIAPTYQGITDWNDAYRTTKDGKQIFYRNLEEVQEAIQKAIESLSVPVLDESPNVVGMHSS